MKTKPLSKYAAHGEPGTEAWIEVYAETYDKAQARHRIYANAPAIKEALELLLSGAKQATENGLNQPQVNGGIVLATAVLRAINQP